MRRIIKNAIKCIHCGDIIESRNRHDFVTCSCGCCSVDGGTDYLRRGFTNSRDDFIDLSEFDVCTRRWNGHVAMQAVLSKIKREKI
jgi:hypothetical protein